MMGSEKEIFVQDTSGIATTPESGIATKRDGGIATTREGGIATTRDGIQIAYRLRKGTGPARLVLIHALGMQGSFWDDMVDGLLPSGDVLVYDCRGHGASTQDTNPYSLDQYADDLADLMDHVGWFSASVAGASMGGCVALAFAGRHPSRLDGLGLIDTTAGYGPDAPVAWEERGQKALSGGMQALLEFQLSRWVSPEFRAQSPASLQAAVAVFLANNPNCYVQTCRMLGSGDNHAVLAGISVPTSVIVGEFDYATPVAMADILAREIPGAELHILADRRHFTVLECPALVVEKLALILVRT
jgi:3-oxoadipate enol-lactonase